jgi:hypothetical protein
MGDQEGRLASDDPLNDKIPLRRCHAEKLVDHLLVTESSNDPLAAAEHKKELRARRDARPTRQRVDECLGEKGAASLSGASPRGLRAGEESEKTISYAGRSEGCRWTQWGPATPVASLATWPVTDEPYWVVTGRPATQPTRRAGDDGHEADRMVNLKPGFTPLSDTDLSSLKN